MYTQVRKWGNSLGVRIPKDITNRLNIKEGEKVSLELSNSYIIIRKEISELDLFLDKISDSNIHNELLNSDKIVGKEKW